MTNLRIGELVIKCAGGTCAVCRMRIEPGDAVQLSANTSRIRHVECMPKSDSRRGCRMGSKPRRKHLSE